MPKGFGNEGVGHDELYVDVRPGISASARKRTGQSSDPQPGVSLGHRVDPLKKLTVAGASSHHVTVVTRVAPLAMLLKRSRNGPAKTASGS